MWCYLLHRNQQSIDKHIYYLYFDTSHAHHGGTNMSKNMLALTPKSAVALLQLKVHLGAKSISRAIREGLSQTSLLKRFGDEDDDIVVERNGKTLILPKSRDQEG